MLKKSIYANNPDRKLVSELEFTAEMEPYFRHVFSQVIGVPSPDLLEMHLDWLKSDLSEQRKLALEFFEHQYVVAAKSARLSKQLIDPILIEPIIKDEAHHCWEQFLDWVLIRARSLDTKLGRQRLKLVHDQLSNTELAWLASPDDDAFRVPMNPAEHHAFYGVFLRFEKLVIQFSAFSAMIADSGKFLPYPTDLIGQPMTSRHGQSMIG